MVANENTTYSKRLLHLISWSHWFTFFNIGAVLLASSYYIFNEPLPDSLLGISYFFATFFSHMAFLTFVGFMLIVFPLTLIFPYTRFIRTSASIIFTLGILLLLLDAFIYSRLGYHLNASAKNQIMAVISNEISHNLPLFWFITGSLFILVLTFEMVISNYAWKHLKQLQQTRFARKIVAILVSLFIFSHVTHIWADAALDYNVLKQDTVLPLSYPTTAKALLTKYGLFDRADYVSRRNAPLQFTQASKPYPKITEQCAITPPRNSAFIILTDKTLTDIDIQLAAKRSQNQSWHYNHHVDSALAKDAWFNLFFSLPSIYQQTIANQQAVPAIMQLVKQANIASEYQFITGQNEQDSLPKDYLTWFTSHKTQQTAANLVFGKKLAQLPVGLYVYHFSGQQKYQLELFVDALLIAQRNKSQKDFIWFGSIGNEHENLRLANKNALFINAKSGHISTKERISSQYDVMPTLINQWLGCSLDTSHYSSGRNLYKLKQDRVIANTVENGKGIMVFNKDKSIMVDQNGNFQSFSRQLNSPIYESADFPLMIDGVHFITQFMEKSGRKSKP